MTLGGWITRTKTWLRAGRDLLYPAGCLVCRQESNDGRALEDGPPICPACLAALAPRGDVLCRLCGGERTAPPAQPGDPCEQCRDHEHAFSAVIAYGVYREDLRDCVLRIKHPHEEFLARALAAAFYARRRDDFAQFTADVLVPVPMHWWRRLRRGTNSAETLATALGGATGIPCDARSLYRARTTQPQGELSATARRKNLRHAFKMRSGADYRGARVFLVDDILTSGATCDEAAKVVLQAGAASVVVVALARAQAPGF